MKQIFTFFFILLVTLVNAQDCDGRYQTDIFTNVDVTTVQFGSALGWDNNQKDLMMDIYQGQGDTATNRPVVIFCFGGSFVGGARNSGELVTFATALAKKGYVCASIDYRLAASAFNLLAEEVMVKVVFGAVQDGKAAIRYFRADAENGNSLGIDPNHIFIGGTSAGGILAINLAYVDSLSKLPATWQTWAGEIGGVEGESGNPGFCSYPNGVFSFAGAVGDTAYINPNDVPFYSCHATGDQTVQYGFGAPLQGFAPVSLYGSGDIATRLTNLGVYNVLDTYTGADHPPLNTAQRMTDTQDHLVDFFFNILDCNPNNQKNADQQDCNSFYDINDTTSTAIRKVNFENTWSVYPNPSNDFITIDGISGFENITIFDAYGRLVYTSVISNSDQIKLNVSQFAKGIYHIQMSSSKALQSAALLIE